MDGLNQVTLIGSVGKDAEVKFFGETSQKASFSLATNKSFKDKNGVKQSETQWHNIELWNEKAKFAGQYVKKGQLVMIIGEIQYDKFEDKEGKTQYRTKIVASKIQLFPKGDNKNSASNGDASTAKQQAEEYATANESFSNSQDDDLPF